MAGALVYRGQAPPTSSADPPGTGTEQLQRAPDAELGPDSTPPARNEASAQNAPRPNSPNDSRGTARRGPERDEATTRADIRKSATEEVQESYSLLLEDLTLTPEEREALVALLIELRIDGTWARGSTWEIRGREIPERERHDRIAAVVGAQKLQEFLALEKNLNAYWETQQIARLLRRRGVPLAETQRTGMFEILADVNARYPYTRPPPELDVNSDEYIEHTLWQLDEFDRHVIELAPSVLSPTQVVHVFNAYEAMSRDRISSVETQKKRRDEDPKWPKGGWFTPARWNAYVTGR